MESAHKHSIMFHVEPTPDTNMNKQQIWALFFASIHSMHKHPGYTQHRDLPMNQLIHLSAMEADLMMKTYYKRFPQTEQNDEQNDLEWAQNLNRPQGD